jgi:hypothetical protein
MECYKEAILWPSNISLAGTEMPTEEADVEANKKHIEKYGAVYWDSTAIRYELKGPFKGYIYTAKPVGKVECEIEMVINRDNLIKIKSEHKYIPDFREQCLKGEFESGCEHDPSHTWIKITKFKKLKKPMAIDEFKKLDGTPVKNVRGGFVYIKKPKLK